MNLRGSTANSYVFICLDVKTEVHSNEVTCPKSPRKLPIEQGIESFESMTVEN